WFSRDWSSDVCSSDLGIELDHGNVVVHPVVGIDGMRRNRNGPHPYARHGEPIRFGSCQLTHADGTARPAHVLDHERRIEMWFGVASDGTKQGICTTPRG